MRAETMRLFGASSLCMTLFALNSVLCRASLIRFGMDASLFTAVRVLSASVALALLCGLSSGSRAPKAQNPEQTARGRASRSAGRAVRQRAWAAGSWAGAVSLFLYTACFSWGSVAVPAAPGTLILFAGVQLTMVGWGVARGSRPRIPQLLGLGAALAGLAGLLLPGGAAPSVTGACLMLCSGAAWGVYCILGSAPSAAGSETGDAPPSAAANEKGGASASATLRTAGNFWRCSLLALILVLWAVVGRAEAPGFEALVCALGAGAVASGAGYVLWYRLVPRFSLIVASTMQLSVPLIAAGLAIVFLGEPLTSRFALCGALVLGGIFSVMRGGKA